MIASSRQRNGSGAKTNRVQRVAHSATRLSSDVLVVDDDVEIARLVADTLQDEGYRVRVAHDGASALIDILHNPPSLVILDVAMPVMVGDELVRYLRRHGYDTLPIIVMTAGLRPESYLAQGATAVLPKPFDLDRLIRVVQVHYPRE
jgi:CheY-like chemotaxis protein